MKALAILISLALPSAAAAFDRTHQAFTNVLAARNDGGLVDYKALKSDPGELNAYLSSLGAVTAAELERWPESDRLAFWINAYNAYTLKAIIDNYPIKSSFLKSALYPKNSIRQIDGVWDEMKWDVAGTKMTLNQIEHETIRKRFREPRIHMALVCAALSCPPLREEAYAGDRLDAQLDDQSRRFMSDPKKGFRIDREGGRVVLSKIFDWFGEDFVPAYGASDRFANRSEKERAVLAFAHAYVKPADQRYLVEQSYALDYLDYDWTLNEQP